MSWSLSHRESGKWFSVDFSRGCGALTWTGLQIQLIRGSLRTTLCMGSTMMTS